MNADNDLSGQKIRSVRVPKPWPNAGEGLDSYRRRVYELHQERIIEQPDATSTSRMMQFPEWIEVFGSEVDAKWESTKGLKQDPKASLESKQRPGNPWYFSNWVLFLLGSTLLLTPAIPVLTWLRGPRTARQLPKVMFQVVLVTMLWVGMYFLGESSAKNDAGQDQTSRDLLMPNVVGTNLGEFIESNSEFNETFFPDSIDLIESRSIWDQFNWTVVAQVPPAGTAITTDDRLCLGVVKNDELALERQRLNCWQEVYSFGELDGFGFTLVSKDLMSVSLNSHDFKGYFLRAKVWIEMKDWNSVMLTYCSYEALGGSGLSTINLKLDPGASGTLFGDGGESFDVGLFNNWDGEYTYEIKKIEKSYGSGCFSI